MAKKRGRKFLRGNIWWIQYWFNGKDRRESTRSTRESVADKLLTKRISGKDDGTLTVAAIKSRKFEDLQAAIERHYRHEQNRSTDRMQIAWKPLAVTFAGWRTNAITEDELNKYVDEREAEGRAWSTIRYELALLKLSFKLAKVPAPCFPKIKVQNTRTEKFTMSEYQAVLTQLPSYLQPPMRAAFYMGWRAKSELLPLEWKHIDFQTGIITLPAEWSKNGEQRQYPFAQFPELKAVFQAQWKAREELQRARGIMIPWVFFRVEKKAVKPIKSYTTAWKNATERAGLPGRWVHDFRRCGATALRDAAVPESIAMSLLGHKTPSMFKRYQITNNADLKAGVERLAAWNASQADNGTQNGTVTAFPVPKKEQHG